MIKKSFTIINIALMTAVVFFGIKLFYSFVTAKLEAKILSADLRLAAPGQDGAAAPDSRSNTGAQRFAAYQPIVERDLFKTGKAKAPEPSIKPSELENLQKTQLKLKLWGTITGNSGTTYAVIEDASKRDQQLYREGDKIQHALIKLILRKKVVLTVSGRDEILEMEEQLDQAHRVSSTQDTEEEELPDAYEAEQEEVSIDREQIDDALQNINNLMRQIRVRPYFEDGKPSGILLSGIRKNSIFEEMGLQSGDVVKGVNGKEIESVDDALKFYQNLKSSSEVELQIQRNGDSQTINYRID